MVCVCVSLTLDTAILDHGYKPWPRGAIDNDTEVIADDNGFLTEQKLQNLELIVISGLYNDIFPRCWGLDTDYDDKALHPQYGDLSKAVGQPNMYKARRMLHERREELNRRMNRITEGKWNWIPEPEPQRRERAVVQRAPPNPTMAEAIEKDLEAAEARRKAQSEKRRQERRRALDDAVAMLGVEQSER